MDSTDRFGNSNSSFYFNSLNTFIDLPNIANLKPNNFPVSFSFWVKMEQSGTDYNSFFLTDYQQNNYHAYWMKVNNNNELSVGYGSGYGDTSPT